VGLAWGVGSPKDMFPDTTSPEGPSLWCIVGKNHEEKPEDSANATSMHVGLRDCVMGHEPCWCPAKGAVVTSVGAADTRYASPCCQPSYASMAYSSFLSTCSLAGNVGLYNRGAHNSDHTSFVLLQLRKGMGPRDVLWTVLLHIVKLSTSTDILWS
jgi:hypothetical protein